MTWFERILQENPLEGTRRSVSWAMYAGSRDEGALTRDMPDAPILRYERYTEGLSIDEHNEHCMKGHKNKLWN